MTRQRRLGWRRDLPDRRDHRLALVSPAHALPSKVDLRPGCPPVYDQKSIGSCTSNAIAAAFDFERAREGLPLAYPSRLFIYFMERLMDGTVDVDGGATLRDGIKVVSRSGTCSEDARSGDPVDSLWPYDVSRFADVPPAACLDAASLERALEYSRVHASVSQMKACLAAGFPFVFGMTCYESFDSPEVYRTGDLPMPARDESVIGGHAVLAVGYSDADRHLIVRNSYGEEWGNRGHFHLPYEYVAEGLVDDCWSIRLVG